jgi:hypothetical protein
MLELKFLQNITFVPFLESFQNPSSPTLSKSILFESQRSDILADSWSNYDTRNSTVCLCFKFNGNVVPIYPVPLSSQLHNLLAVFLLGSQEQDGPVPANGNLFWKIWWL